MVRKVIRWTFLGIIVFIIILWFLGGGIGKIREMARSFHFLTFSDLLVSSSSLSSFQLPWAPAMPQINVTPVYMPGDQGATPSPPPAPAGDHSSYANASTFAGKVVIEEGAARTQTTSGEYVILVAGASDSPIDISGWSLESALTGVRAYIPQASGRFMQGAINTVADVQLAPGGQAIIITGASPIGVSFRENSCTGYLGTLQPFVPALSRNCPALQSTIPRTPANESRLGANCLDYVAEVPLCTFPSSPPISLSATCRLEVQTRLSYAGCVEQFKNTIGFAKNSWRLYFAQGAPLWQTQHDVIRLLDGQGRIVDVLNY